MRITKADKLSFWHMTYRPYAQAMDEIHPSRLAVAAFLHLLDRRNRELNQFHVLWRSRWRYLYGWPATQLWWGLLMLKRRGIHLPWC